MSNGRDWSELQQVPLKAWFRYKTRLNDVFPITEINLQYCGGAMPGLTLKATPAVKIDSQWWRPAELSSVFDVSLDGFNWQQCEGDLVSSNERGNLADRFQKIENTLGRFSEVNENMTTAIEKTTSSVWSAHDKIKALEKQIVELKQPSEKSPAGDSAPEAKPKGDGKKS